MPTNVPLQSIKLASTTTTVTFSNIDQSYNDLRVVVSGFTGGANVDVRGKINGDTGANYSRTTMEAVGVYLGGNYGQDHTWARFGWCPSGTTYQTQTLDFLNYNDTSNYKMILQRATINSLSYMGAINWRGTAAITSIEFTPDSGNFNEGTTFSLYGVRSGGTAKASGGDIVVSDGTYWYHAFLRTSAFTPAVANLTADVLVVAGGGGAGANQGGGGGAGGFRAITSQSLTASPYTVIVGSGGAGDSYAMASGSSGTNSSFSGSGITTITSTGGGGGGSVGGALSGGSGGGGTGNNTSAAAGNAGSYSPVEGFAGAPGRTSGGQWGGGGGGAAAAAENPNTTGSATGGAGTSSYSSWGSATGTGQLSGGTYYYAGGGGGCKYQGGDIYPGGLGGGGRGGAASGVNGTANTGGGGGGQSNGGGGAGGSGGSGIVIVRYAV